MTETIASQPRFKVREYIPNIPMKRVEEFTALKKKDLLWRPERSRFDLFQELLIERNGANYLTSLILNCLIKLENEMGDMHNTL